MAFGVWKDHKAAWNKGVSNHGKVKMVFALVTIPLWILPYLISTRFFK
jgi:hypothetical protein